MLELLTTWVPLDVPPGPYPSDSGWTVPAVAGFLVMTAVVVVVAVGLIRRGRR